MKSFNSIQRRKNISLLTVAIISLLIMGLVRTKFIYTEEVPQAGKMKKSVALAKEWFEIVIDEKNKRDIVSDALSNVKYRGMLGNDFTYITTTLGSLESKEISTNPAFAAVITGLILDADIRSGSTVGISISGSFPALTTAVLASLQIVGAESIIFSSVGASSYGANQPGATWPDMESWLRERGGLKYKTSVLTPGGEDDNGGGLTDEGVNLIKEAAQRNLFKIFVPATLEESVEFKLKMLLENNIDLFINIGGNQASMGACPHAVTIPNGLNKGTKICSDNNRGLISLVAEQGVPYLHLLNLKDLAVQYGIPLEPGTGYGSADNIYLRQSVNKPVVIIFVIILSGFLVVYKTRIGS